MKILVALCFFTLFSGIDMPDLARSSPVAAPPVKCEIKLATWCILEGAYEISRVLASDGVNDRIWILRGPFRPDSKLVVLEPDGCETGVSDTFALLGVEKAIAWQSKQWDRIRFRLKHDNSCDLQILVPVRTGDPMEWAYSEGLQLLRSCTRKECPSQNFGDLMP